jgi:co-chaperonin GroES (HSP10)
VWQPTSPEEKLLAGAIEPVFSNIVVLPDQPPPSVIARPDGAEERPLSGRIIAIGWDVDRAEFAPGRRVVFSPHAGNEYKFAETEDFEGHPSPKVNGVVASGYVMSPEEVQLLLPEGVVLS